MYSKNIKLKSDVMMKQGERKRLRNQLLNDWKSYVCSDIGFTMEQIETLVPLKEPFYQKKYQHADKNSFVYCSDTTVVGFQFSTYVVPSLQSVWFLKLTGGIKLFVPSNVISILGRGADLMAPGVCNLLSIETSFQCGDICFICTSDSSVPLAIGCFLISYKQLESNCFKGKLASILHITGDELCKSSKNFSIPTEDEFNNTFDEKLQLTEDVPTISGDINDLIHNNCHQTGIQSEHVVSLTMEQVLEYSLLLGLKKCKKVFPILCSSFQSQYLFSSCPAGYSVDVKKSRFKKTMNFYREYEQKGLLSLSVAEKDIWSISSADFGHELFRGFQVMEIGNENEKDVVKESEESDDADNLFQNFVFPEITSLYSVTKPFSNVFETVEKGDVLTSQQVKELVKDYITKNCEFNKAGVTLDPKLSSLLLTKQENFPTLSWQDVNTRSVSSLQQGYEIKGGSFSEPSFVKGKLYPVLKIKTERRAGNKHVSIIENLEKFGIDLKLFAKFLQRLAASSSSVTNDNSSKLEVVLVQGNQIKLLRKLFLDKLKFPVKFVDVPLK